LKNVPLVDVCILVAGFLIRIIYGALITEIEVSNWLYLTVISISFYFALGKRRNELKKMGDGDTRKVLQFYPESFLDKNMYMCLALANVFYALWSMDAGTVASYGSNRLIFTVPIVLPITMKYSLDIEVASDGGVASDGDPVEVLIHDKPLILLCFFYFFAMFQILYIF
jgi:4-hydroxybenzoate polyprenyltransferase